MSKKESNRDKAMQKARELGKEYENLYVGCAQSSFAAIVDALRSEAGIELFTPEEQDKIFTAFVGLSGGVGMSAKGTCGAVTGASFAVSFASGKGRKEQLADKWAPVSSSKNVRDSVVSKMSNEFGSIICREICFCRFGKSYDFTKSEVAIEFLSQSRKHPQCTVEGCTISKAAAWAVEKICDMKGIE
jgi:hypothetical protein